MKPTQERRYTLHKSGRLHHKTLVDSLFSQGKSLYAFPLRVMWRVLGEEELQGSFRLGAPDGIAGMQMMVTVPKKKRRKAVDRVLMRRRIREAYRKKCVGLKDYLRERDDIRTLSVAFVYIASENVRYSRVERKMESLLGSIEEELRTRKPAESGARNE